MSLFLVIVQPTRHEVEAAGGKAALQLTGDVGEYYTAMDLRTAESAYGLFS